MSREYKRYCQCFYRTKKKKRRKFCDIIQLRNLTFTMFLWRYNNFKNKKKTCIKLIPDSETQT